MGMEPSALCPLLEQAAERPSSATNLRQGKTRELIIADLVVWNRV
jgi:hypothetical protein